MMSAKSTTRHRSKKRPAILTDSQRALAEQIQEVGQLHFRRSWRKELIRPRTSLLIAGPTGTGKSHSVRLAAERLGAHYVLASAGTWIPAGAYELQSTMLSIVGALKLHKRVLLHLDEIDKFYVDSDGGWSRSCRQDLFALLEGILTPNADKRKLAALPGPPTPSKPSPEVPPSGSAKLSHSLFARKPPEEKDSKPEETLEQMAERLFIVGSGTWQEVFANTHNPIGFGAGHQASPVNTNSLPNLSPEVRRRFKAPILFLSYPTPEESDALCREFQLTALAERAGVRFDAANIDWENEGGMSFLQSLKTDLECILQRQRMASRKEALSDRENPAITNAL